MKVQSGQEDATLFRFVFMGASLDTGNMGVSALAASVIDLLLRHRPEAEISLFIGNRSSLPQKIEIQGRRYELQVANFRWSPKAILKNHIAVVFILALIWRLIPVDFFRRWLIGANHLLSTMAAADLVGEIRGGDSFSDIYGFRRFLMGTMPLSIALLLKRPIWFLPQTYGPFKSWASRKIAAIFMRNADGLLSRDKESIPLIANLLGNSAKIPHIEFCPDVAFTLECHEVETPDIVPPLELVAPKERLIGFNINGLMYNGGYTRDNMFSLKMDYREFTSLLIKKLLADKRNHILLVPHTFGVPGNVNSDPDACRYALEEIPEQLKLRLHMVMKEYDQSAIKSIIGRCDFFIGSRMHSCIGALSQGIPTIGVAYSKKFLGVFNSVGAGPWVVDGRSESAVEAVHKTSDALDGMDQMQNVLRQNLPAIQKQINECFWKMLK